MACKCKYNCRRFTEVEVRMLHTKFVDDQFNFVCGLKNIIIVVKQKREISKITCSQNKVHTSG